MFHIFSHFRVSDQKTPFTRFFTFLSKKYKMHFQNRKWNYPNRKWNYFSYFQASDKKIPFTKCFTFDPRGSKLFFKTGNGIIQTGNGIISPTSRPLIKKNFFPFRYGRGPFRPPLSENHDFSRTEPLLDLRPVALSFAV